ncbi:3-keto-5-aminohexanoate cleavage protein [Haloarcula marina]|uniref:3-keto-5-aminohexanoate cleavage protein n=1 Tax=Haloarcula marina TaxID=2961574 RepID=UPI0020B66168|nr:3-keto-5-aminohexanoate cleavage protein [Halomicroarcula marina]
MTYSDYMRGDEAILGVAPTGYRYSTDVNEHLPVTPEAVAKHVYESASLGASVAHLHGRDEDGDPDATRLPAFATAVRDICADDVLIDYAVAPDCELGDFFAVLDEDPVPDIATVRVGPAHYEYRGTTTTTRRDVDRFVEGLVDRRIKPNLLVTNGRDIHEVNRLVEESVLDGPPLVTLLFGARDGTVATPMNALSLLEAVPDEAQCLVRATGPNQYPLTTLAFFLGAHPVVGMEDNLFFDPERPVERNAQLVRQVAEIARNALRPVATADEARSLVEHPRMLAEDDGMQA